MPRAPRSRKASCPAAAWRCCGPRSRSSSLKLEGDEQFGVTIVRRACEEPIRQIVLNCGTEGAVVVEKIKSAARSQLRLQRLHRAV